MRIANVGGRATVVTGENRGVDVEKASDGRFGPGLASVYEDWAEFSAWAADLEDQGDPFDPADLQAPSPAPRQVFAVGLNYSAHAAESGFEVPENLPPVFTKYVSSFTGPYTAVEIPGGGNVDWEIELVAVIGTEGANIAPGQGWSHVAGLTIGQDISERVSQLAGPAPQFGLAKSFPGFSPMGPHLVSVEEFDDRDAINLECDIDGETVQSDNTRAMIFGVSELIEKLSENVSLYPGDVIFTGTPEGVGMGRTPQRFLQPGEVLNSRIEGIGEMRQEFRAAGN